MIGLTDVVKTLSPPREPHSNLGTRTAVKDWRQIYLSSTTAETSSPDSSSSTQIPGGIILAIIMRPGGQKQIQKGFFLRAALHTPHSILRHPCGPQISL